MTDDGKALRDTDWHVDRLYHFANALDSGIRAHLLVANYSRYVIDVNRGPDDRSLYPGQFTTGLCPTVTFANQLIYKDGQAPSEDEIEARTDAYWRPFHDRISDLLQQLRARYGYALLYDAHSICSTVPRLFDGTLPDLNMGTNKGNSLPAEMEQELFTICEDSSYSAVLNGRFTGGYITRHYGNPAQQRYAMQMELAQSSYMQEALPYAYLTDRAEALQQVLARLLKQYVALVSG